MSINAFTAAPAATNCRLIAFEKAELHPGIIPGTWFLSVSGRAPCLNMNVDLVPHVYVRCPEYWGIEVVGCIRGGICLPALKRYHESIPLAGITGSIGIEVIGAKKTKKLKVSGGCKAV